MICWTTFIIGLVFIGLGTLGIKIGGVRVLGIGGGLGAVLIILSIFGIGCSTASPILGI